MTDRFILLAFAQYAFIASVFGGWAIVHYL